MKRKLRGDAGLSTRMFVVMFLLAALYLLFIGVMVELGVPFIGVMVIAVGMLAVQYFLSDTLVLMSVGAKEVSPQEAPDLHARIERLAAMMDLPKPKVAIIDHYVPNALATGRSPGHSVVAVTTGIMERLSSRELDAVLAHEMSHIAHRDVMVMTIASFFSTVAFFLVRWLLFFGGGHGDRRERDSGASAMMLAWLASLLVWFISFLLLRTLSRYRELAADRGGAIVTGAPSQLAAALLKITGDVARIPTQDLREIQGASAFFFSPIPSGELLMGLLSTHPSLENRLAQLKELEKEFEGV